MMETTVYATDIDPAKERSFNYCPESMAHPAKMPPSLVRALILTYSKKGDVVLDPMCGIGTTLVESLLLGRNAIGVELEAKFAAWAKANCEKATVNNTHALVQRKLGTAVVLQGDARNLEALLRDNADSIVFSPPFSSETVSPVSENSEIGGVVDQKFGYQKKYDEEENIAFKQYGEVDSVVFSPPIGGSEQVSPGDREKKTETYKQGIDDEGYDDAASIAFKPTYGNVDAIVSSPPYADALTGDGEKAKAYMRQRLVEGKATSLRPDVFSTRAPSQQGGIWGGYGRSEGNIGNLRHGDIDDLFVDAVVCSQPYADAVNAPQSEEQVERRLKRMEQAGHGKEARKRRREFRRGSRTGDLLGSFSYTGKVDAVVTSPPYSDVMDANRHGDTKRSKEVGEEKGLPRQVYGDQKVNIGNLQHGNVDAIVSSPPFEGVEPFQDKDFDLNGKRAGDQASGTAYTEDKTDKAQLDNLKGETYLAAMAKVYRGCFAVLKGGGLYGTRS